MSRPPCNGVTPPPATGWHVRVQGSKWRRGRVGGAPTGKRALQEAHSGPRPLLCATRATPSMPRAREQYAPSSAAPTPPPPSRACAVERADPLIRDKHTWCCEALPSRCVARAGRATPCRQQAPTGVSGKLFPPSLILPLHTQRARHARTSSMAPSWRAQSGSQERVLLAAKQGSPPPPLPASATPRCTPRAAPHGAKSKSPVPHRARCVCGWGGATEVGEVKECIGAPSLAPSLGSQILSFPETLHKKALSFPPLLQKAKHSPAPHSERARSTPRVWPMPMGPAAGWSAATELRDRVR